MRADPEISGIGPLLDALPEGEWLKLMEALEELIKDNPDLPIQLQRLADLKKRKPATFKVALDKLNKL